MRIKMLTAIAGMTYSHKPGDVVDWPDQAEAVRLVEAGHAVPVQRSPETATARPGQETATKPDAGKGDSKPSKPTRPPKETATKPDAKK